MMKCDEIQELFGTYWDLPEYDLKRQRVDEHVKNCRNCSIEFDFWKESTELIQSASAAEELTMETPSISKNVMSRIYQDESWRVPVTDRKYAISYKFRRNATAAIAACLALFLFSFVYSIVYQPAFSTSTASNSSTIFGKMQEPVVVNSSTESMNVHSMPSAVASLKGFSEPFMYQVGPIQTLKDYMIFISLLGLTCTLLIMNWLSRTRT